VTDFVDDNLSMDLGISEMAGVANLSPYHFSRQFKRSTGLSPHQYVIGRRVERARELLSGTDLSVGAVASAVGFAHQSHLAYHVRRRFGVAPSSLRR
jgi:AraC family transcriptional regulator